MVNKIPSYSISAGGRFAVVASRSHPYAAAVMVPACCDALESAGVATDDIYIIDAPSDLLLPSMSRELSKTEFYSAIVALAILPESETLGESVLNGFTTTDFLAPVVPGLVTAGVNELNELARIAQDAARSAIEMTNFSGMLDEMRGAVGNGGSIGREIEELEEEEELLPPTPRKRRGRPRKAGPSAVAAAPKRGPGRPAKAGKTTSKNSSKTATVPRPQLNCSRPANAVVADRRKRKPAQQPPTTAQLKRLAAGDVLAKTRNHQLVMKIKRAGNRPFILRNTILSVS
jgi:6,7-dimethyl-8-ribityllumazine synthase